MNISQVTLQMFPPFKFSTTFSSGAQKFPMIMGIDMTIELSLALKEFSTHGAFESDGVCA